jgi:putative Mg2+ transporter-C (MgtC) family protein
MLSRGMDAISNPATFGDIVFRLLLATAVGAAIGVNREMRLKPAGLRTHALVSLGAALLTLIGLQMVVFSGARDASALSRVVQGLVAGIGFIGGGTILHRDDARVVHGLSTAASIWVVAAVGIASGCGMWRSALTTVALVLFILIAGQPVDDLLRRVQARHHAGAPK